MIQSFFSCCYPAKKSLDDTPQRDPLPTNYTPNHSSQSLLYQENSMKKKKGGISLKFGMIETIRQHQNFFPNENQDDLQTKDIAELSAILSNMEDKLDESKRLYKPILHALESNRRD